MDNQSPRFLDGITSRPLTVQLSLTDQSLILFDGNVSVAVWPYSKVFVKEDWVHPTGGILGCKDNPDAGLSILRNQEFKNILQRIPKRHQSSFIIPTQYRHLFLMAVGAVAASFALFPVITHTASFLLNFIPHSVEQKLGNMVVSEMKNNFKPCDDKAAIASLQKITQRLSLASGEKNVDPKIYLFKSKTPNAFSLPGQNIAVLSAFLNEATSENEIAAVMAHEMGHMTKRDSMEAYIESQGINIISGLIGSSGAYSGVADFASFVQSMSYSRKKEFMADEYGVKLLLKAGYSPNGLSSFLLRADKKEKTEIGQAMKYVEFLSTHPDTQERVNRIQKFAGTANFKPSLRHSEFLELKNSCRS